MDIESLVDAYCLAWSEPDEARRAGLIARVWATDAVYADPGVHLLGREALNGHIGRILAGRPGARVVRASAVDVHHGFARFDWQVLGSDGTVLKAGVDFMTLGGDGCLIQGMVGFFAPAGTPA